MTEFIVAIVLFVTSVVFAFMGNMTLAFFFLIMWHGWSNNSANTMLFRAISGK